MTEFDELKLFIKEITLFLQKHSNYNAEKIEPMFQRAYKLYVKYDVDNPKTRTSRFWGWGGWMTERSKGERMVYLKAEIIKLEETDYPEHMTEMREICIKALKDRIEKIIAGECWFWLTRPYYPW
jgi:hypothetical protein